MAETLKIIVVGNGMVGHHFVEQLVTQQHPNINFDITVLAAESRLAYDRVHLSEYFTGKRADDLAMTSEATYDQWRVAFHLNSKVTQIDRAKQIVTTHNGDQYTFDKLILATGSYPFVPPIPGNEQSHCLVYRTIEDLQEIERCAKESRVGVVVGGGLLGLEAANALKEAGLKTHIVEFAPQLMGVQIDSAGGTLLRNKIESLGVEVHTSKATVAIEQGTNHRYRMNFKDGGHLETDLILFSAGIRPYDELADLTGLEKGERGGFAINNQCQTSDPNIYAIGECAAWNNFIFGLVAPGYQMAKITVQKLINPTSDEKFIGADMSTKLKLMGVEVGSIGDAHGNTAGSQSYTYENQPQGIYKKIVVNHDGTKLIGAVLVGDTSDYDSLLQYMLNGIDLPEHAESLILPNVNNGPVLGADALPDSATICSCHNVTKSDIVNTITAGSTELATVKSCTKASTGCGGCAALLKDVFDTAMENLGFEVKKDICEHFAYSRLELFNIVKIEKIETFEDLLQRHGHGLGCDICKPTVASILASLWNDYVLEKNKIPLQDTNDTYLANMQKDGSYSVVPRVPGGEITPDKLIVLGEVAKKYDLYTKITGGQRVDLFGARVDQLPSIWAELIDAGFETGHAYGKAVRTVKSCVGSTWCRYGVQDSVAMAIFIENRYKGIRAPHKIKFAVSGCTRECAEAQSKDIGVIATENGWNLYVCGNGGMRPRHAELFASDLNDDTLILYIDRILSFYINTADRLQRTSVWMENMEGGLDYLRQVVIDDHLGVCDELERQIAHVIANYQCEWKTTINDPEALKRFKPFVNSNETDSTIEFVRERGQIRPAIEKEKSIKQSPHLIPVIEAK
ncbi:nitrite reductase large subunit [Aliikangiella marina]|uniref:Nitrite reductase large subunit n=1 Tax=Aliikangiella marina TaxID=1712262 RepID=A0A545TI53_9GAMM|nr:nitrite reductase large subunit NirB [Aliikangiella marina]TQV76851.1 nitrite reductase large subunit [Aliikangiella marina]